MKVKINKYWSIIKEIEVFTKIGCIYFSKILKPEIDYNLKDNNDIALKKKLKKNQKIYITYENIHKEE